MVHSVLYIIVITSKGIHPSINYIYLILCTKTICIATLSAINASCTLIICNCAGL